MANKGEIIAYKKRSQQDQCTHGDKYASVAVLASGALAA